MQQEPYEGLIPALGNWEEEKQLESIIEDTVNSAVRMADHSGNINHCLCVMMISLLFGRSMMGVKVCICTHDAC